MDGLIAKRILTALARKLGYSNVVIAKFGNSQYWQLVIRRYGGYNRILYVKDGQSMHAVISKSRAWNSFLPQLEGCVVQRVLNDKDIPVKSIEQLVIDLELEGFLKNI